MKNILSSLNAFIKLASKNKLWVFASALFITCLTFTWNFVLAYPSKNAEFQKNAIDFNTQIQDLDNLDRVYGLLDESYKAYYTVLDVYINTRNGISAQGVFDEKVFNDAIEKVGEASSVLSVSIGTMKSITFNEPSYAQFVNESITDLTSKRDELNVKQSFLKSALSRDKEKLLSDLEILKAYDEKFMEQTAQMYERFQDNHAQFLAVESAHEIKIQEETRKIKLFRTQELLAWLSGFYILGFLIVAFTGWQKYRLRNKSRKKRTVNNKKKDKEQKR